MANENNQLKQTVEGLERERDFYFSKLRDIELLIQQAVENDPQVEGEEGGLVKMIQQILYSTEVSKLSLSPNFPCSFTDNWIRKALRYPLKRRVGQSTMARLSRAGTE